RMKGAGAPDARPAALPILEIPEHVVSRCRHPGDKVSCGPSVLACDEMKPAPFEYSRPHSLDEACAMLAEADESRLIAGGQTLVPLMANRLARPKRLIDIGRLSELAFIRGEGDAITIGATTRQSAAADNALVQAGLPLLHKVLPHVGHGAIRARGTIGGSLANADPA